VTLRRRVRHRSVVSASLTGVYPWLTGKGTVPWKQEQLGYQVSVRSDAPLGQKLTSEVTLAAKDEQRFNVGKAVVVGIEGTRTAPDQFHVTGVWVKPRGRFSTTKTYSEADADVKIMVPQGQTPANLR
jgi:hypothetical protein